jgi:hypothetical protein
MLIISISYGLWYAWAIDIMLSKFRMCSQGLTRLHYTAHCRSRELNGRIELGVLVERRVDDQQWFDVAFLQVIARHYKKTCTSIGDVFWRVGWLKIFLPVALPSARMGSDKWLNARHR